MEKKIEPRKSVENGVDSPDHGVITAGPDAHDRERRGYTPPGNGAASKDGVKTEK